VKKSFSILTVLVLSVFFCRELEPAETAVQPKADKPIEERFFDYVTGKGKAYKALKEYQEDADFHLKSGHVLSLAWFYKGEIRIAMIFMLDNFGNYVLVKNLFNWEKKTVKKGRLAPEKLQQIKDATNKLEEEKTGTKTGKEYYVSYRKGLRWKSNVYDISKLPGYVQSVIKAAGLAEELK